MGEAENFPPMCLQKAVARDNACVQLRDGEVRKAKMRTPELMRTAHSAASADTSLNTSTITGNGPDEPVICKIRKDSRA